MRRVMALLAIVTLLAGCGGDSASTSAAPSNNSGGNPGTTPTTLTGVFVDAPVQGLAYSTPTLIGVTDANGTFSYVQGEVVTFSIGNIVIGSVAGQAVITPVNLVAGATDTTDAQVINIAQFLLTIDEDLNSSNGIQITPAMRAAAAGMPNVDFSDPDFDTNVATVIATMAAGTSNPTRTLVSNNTAQNHLNQSLGSLVAATYSGTYTGTDSGTWVVSIGADGSLNGSGISATDGPFGLTGNIVNGVIQATAFGGVDAWTGAIDPATGAVTGAWQVIGSNEGGTFSGTRTTSSFDLNGRTASSIITASYCPGVSGGFLYSFNLTGMTLTGSDTFITNNNNCSMGPQETINALYGDFPELLACGPLCQLSALNRSLVDQTDADGRTFNLITSHAPGSDAMTIIKTITADPNGGSLSLPVVYTEVLTFNPPAN